MPARRRDQAEPHKASCGQLAFLPRSEIQAQLDTSVSKAHARERFKAGALELSAHSGENTLAERGVESTGPVSRAEERGGVLGPVT